MRQRVPNANYNYLTPSELAELKLEEEYAAHKRSEQGPDNAPRKEARDAKRIP